MRTRVGLEQLTKGTHLWAALVSGDEDVISRNRCPSASDATNSAEHEDKRAS